MQEFLTNHKEKIFRLNINFKFKAETLRKGTRFKVSALL